MDYHLLSDLTLDNKGWRIKIRITRIWDSVNPTLNNQLISLDCIIVDEKVSYSFE